MTSVLWRWNSGGEKGEGAPILKASELHQLARPSARVRQTGVEGKNWSSSALVGNSVWPQRSRSQPLPRIQPPSGVDCCFTAATKASRVSVPGKSKKGGRDDDVRGKREGEMEKKKGTKTDLAVR